MLKISILFHFFYKIRGVRVKFCILTIFFQQEEDFWQLSDSLELRGVAAALAASATTLLIKRILNPNTFSRQEVDSGCPTR